jgi:hypothetical protein
LVIFLSIYICPYIFSCIISISGPEGWQCSVRDCDAQSDMHHYQAQGNN